MKEPGPSRLAPATISSPISVARFVGPLFCHRHRLSSVLFPFFLIFTTTTPLSFSLQRSTNSPPAASNAETFFHKKTFQSDQVETELKPQPGNPLDNTVDYTNILHNSTKPQAKDPKEPPSEDEDDEMTDDQKFLERIQNSLRTAQHWENDTELLQNCRNVIPWQELRTGRLSNDTASPYADEEQDRCLEGNALFLQRMCRWFPKALMNWVNAPPCKVCGSTDCEMKTVRGPETQEEKDVQAKRVEGRHPSEGLL